MTKTNLDEKYQSILDTIRVYPDQLNQAWKEVAEIEFPHDFQHINKVAVCAMGGSALGARIVDSLLVNRIRIPIEIFNQYHIPNYSDDKTLIIAYSYSGGTEETISALFEAITRETKIFGITTGGKLKEILEEHNLSHYIFDPKFNPSKQPRMGLGYAVGSILGLFSKLQFAHITEEEVESAVNIMRDTIKDYDVEVKEHENLAKKFAKDLKNKVAILIASEHLYGTAYSIKNQINETAKTFASLEELPELNHHLLEGLKNPARIHETFNIIFFNSDLYSDRVRKRYPLTAEVVAKNGINYSLFMPKSGTKIEQVFETLIFGIFVAYYLSRSYGIDPTEIPWVDYFKKKLAKM